MQNKYLTVTALNKYIAYKFDSDNALRKVYIKGEVSNLRISGGHIYFSLKDDASEIRAIMFSSNAKRLNFMPQDGITVLVTAQVTIYQKNGTYSLMVSEMLDIGLGELHLNFLRLKEKLQKEGLFDESKKKLLPEVINNIGVITSATADAFHDIVTTVNKRWPIANIYLYPSLVQGMDAPRAIIRALEKANSNPELDVVIIARGGGSAEDLSCFNDEELARAVFGSRLPTVSGVGHEADSTIIDFVASKRAATPTAAAVAVTKDQYLIAKELNDKLFLLVSYYKKILEKNFYEYDNLVNNHYFKNFSKTIEQKEDSLKQLTYSLRMNSPLNLIEKSLTKLNELDKRIELYSIEDRIVKLMSRVDNNVLALSNSYNTNLIGFENKFERLIDKMIVINPLNLLKKGYVLSYQNDKLLVNANQVDLNKNIKIVFQDGELEVKPLKIKKNKLGE